MYIYVCVRVCVHRWCLFFYFPLEKKKERKRRKEKKKRPQPVSIRRVINGAVCPDGSGGTVLVWMTAGWMSQTPDLVVAPLTWFREMCVCVCVRVVRCNIFPLYNPQ